MSLACITSHQLYYITSSLHHLDALHHLTSEYTNRANPMYYTRCHMYYMGFTFTDETLGMEGKWQRVCVSDPDAKNGVGTLFPDLRLVGSPVRRPSPN